MTNAPAPDIGNAPIPLEGVQGFVSGLVTKYPWVATIILAIGALRLLLKPVMLAVEWYAKQSPNPNDDVAVLKFEAGPVDKWLSIGLDIFGSVKLPALAPPKPQGK